MKNISTFGKLLILLLTISIIAIVCFLAVAFVKAEINPFLWEERVRTMLIFSIILFSVLPMGMILGELTNLSE
jgi:hypothetical protein